MQLIDGESVYSATDIVGFLACEHLTALERAALAGLVSLPTRLDPELEIIQKRGFEHEQRHLEELRARGRHVVEIPAQSQIRDYGERLRQESAATRAVMVDGRHHLSGHPLRWSLGRTRRLPPPGGQTAGQASFFGPYHYEVADTKLARHVKVSALLQICSYVDQLERVQGVRPAWLHVVLGGNPRRTETFRVDDFFAYYSAVRSRFEGAVGSVAPKPTYPLPVAPEPVEHCEVCRWAETCDARRREDDHLSLVAAISQGQRRELRDRGINTLAALARLPLPVDPPPERTSRSALERVRDQARRTLHKLLLPIEPNKGLAGAG